VTSGRRNTEPYNSIRNPAKKKSHRPRPQTPRAPHAEHTSTRETKTPARPKSQAQSTATRIRVRLGGEARGTCAARVDDGEASADLGEEGRLLTASWRSLPGRRLSSPAEGGGPRTGGVVVDAAGGMKWACVAPPRLGSLWRRRASHAAASPVGGPEVLVSERSFAAVIIRPSRNGRFGPTHE
jgi:hypothetical protein